MKIVTSCIAALALILGATSARAEDKSDSTPKKEKDKKVQSEVQVFRFGKVVTIDSNGKVEVTDIGNADTDPKLKALTEEAQANLKKALGELGQLQVQAEANQIEGKATKGKMKVFKKKAEAEAAEAPIPEADAVFPEELRQLQKQFEGLDSEKQLLERLRKAMLDRKALSEEQLKGLTENNEGVAQGQGKVSGSMKIVVIGPDGKRNEMQMQLPEKVAAGAQGLLPMLESGSLPKEALQALQAAGKELQQRHRIHREEKTSDDINAKLDKILNRLESLEGDVKTLKAEKDAGKK